MYYNMKSKNNNKTVSSEKSEREISNDKKANVNVNTYMKKSKRNKENIVRVEPQSENNENTENDIPVVRSDPHSGSTHPLREVIPEIPDIKLSVKALNLIKARAARKSHLVSKNTEREQKILSLVNEFQQDEYLKLQSKTEKLKNKLMKLI